MSVDYNPANGDVIGTATNLANPLAHTIFLWFKQRSGTVADNVILLNNSGPVNAQAFVISASTLIAYAGGGANVFSPTPVLGNWNAMALTCPGTGANATIAYWRDNASSSWTSMTLTETAFSPAANNFGNGLSGGVGSYYCIKEWDVALTLPELNAEFLTAGVAKSANLRRFLLEDTGANAGTDSSGNGFNLTVFGSPVTGADNPTFPGPTGPTPLGGPFRTQMHWRST